MFKLFIIFIISCIFISQPNPTLQDNYFLKPPKIKVYSNFEEFRQMNRSLLESLLNAIVNHQNNFSNPLDPVLTDKFKNFHKMLAQNLNLKKQVSSSSFDSLHNYEDETE